MGHGGWAVIPCWKPSMIDCAGSVAENIGAYAKTAGGRGALRPSAWGALGARARPRGPATSEAER
eukprot:9074897-Pyramimonas_sp.AAC.1